MIAKRFIIDIEIKRIWVNPFKPIYQLQPDDAPSLWPQKVYERLEVLQNIYAWYLPNIPIMHAAALGCLMANTQGCAL